MRVQDRKSGKSRLKPTWHHFGGKINWFRPPKKRAQKRAHDLENQRCSKLRSKAGSNSSIQFVSNGSKLAPRNLDPGPPSKVGLSIHRVFFCGYLLSHKS